MRNYGLLRGGAGQPIWPCKRRICMAGKTLQVLVPRGIRIAIGIDAVVSKHGRHADEFELMVPAGMAPEMTFVAATINARWPFSW